MPVDIIGSTILGFGHLDTECFEGGGLGLRYKTPNSEIKTILFDLTECGASIVEQIRL